MQKRRGAGVIVSKWAHALRKNVKSIALGNDDPVHSDDTNGGFRVDDSGTRLVSYWVQYGSQDYRIRHFGFVCY